MTEQANKLAEKYLTARDEAQSNDNSLDKLKEKRGEWESKMEGLDEDDPLYDIAKKNFEEYQQKAETIEESRDSLRDYRDSLLEAVGSRFVPRDEWVDEEVIRAINLSILGVDRDFIEIGTVRLEPDNGVSDDEEVFEIATLVRAIANEELGESTELQQYWVEFQDLERFEYFTEIASAEEPLSGKDIAMIRGEEDRRQAISQALINTTKGEFNPYFKEGRGEYSLSFLGEYLLRRYGDEVETPTDEEEEGDSESTATLENFD